MKKVLLLGLGFFGSHWYETIKTMDNCQLVGICALQEDIDKLAARRLVVEPAFTDYQKAIEQTGAKIVIIVVPTPLHTAIARFALARGLHVLSEKPLTVSLSDARDIVKFKQQYPRLKYMVSQNYRRRPHIQTLKKCLDDGMAGAVGSILLEFRRPEDLIGYRPFLEMPLIQDVSIHHFDLIRFITSSNCQRLYADSFHPVWSDFTGESSADILMNMENGIHVNYCATWAARGKATSWDGAFSISGSLGCLVTDCNNDIAFFPKAGGRIPVEPLKMEITEQKYALSMLIRSIDQGDIPECSIEDNYHSFAMVDAAERSNRSGTVAMLD